MRRKNAPPTGPWTPPQHDARRADAGQSAGAEPGVGSLKYAGIGPRRERGAEPKKLTGDEITSLGSLEAEVMGVLWEIGCPATGNQVTEAALSRARQEGREPTGFATVATTLRRLADKDLLSATKDRSEVWYAPTVGRSRWPRASSTTSPGRC